MEAGLTPAMIARLQGLGTKGSKKDASRSALALSSKSLWQLSRPKATKNQPFAKAKAKAKTTSSRFSSTVTNTG